MELEEQPYSIVELLTLPNWYVSGLEGIHIFNNSFLCVSGGRSRRPFGAGSG